MKYDCSMLRCTIAGLMVLVAVTSSCARERHFVSGQGGGGGSPEGPGAGAGGEETDNSGGAAGASGGSDGGGGRGPVTTTGGEGGDGGAGANGGAGADGGAGGDGAGGGAGNACMHTTSTPGDITGDGCVDMDDYDALLVDYGRKVADGVNPCADINRDGWIDELDYVEMSAHWGEGCGAAP